MGSEGAPETVLRDFFVFDMEKSEANKIFEKGLIFEFTETCEGLALKTTPNYIPVKSRDVIEKTISDLFVQWKEGRRQNRSGSG